MRAQLPGHMQNFLVIHVQDVEWKQKLKLQYKPSKH